MSRGPRPIRAKEESLPIAEKRGLVMRYQHRQGNVCDFSLMSPGLVCFICVMRLTRLTSTPEDILHDFSSVIGQLRFIASSPAISRELWLRTPRGAWRFFRVLDDSLLELDRDGMPLKNTVPGTVASPGVAPVKKPGPAKPAGKKSRRGRQSATGNEPVTKANPAQDPVPVNDPAPEKDRETATPPGKSPRQEKAPAPNPVPENDPGPVNNRECMAIPEKSPEPVLYLGPPEDSARAPEPDPVPEHIRKFLHQRHAAREKTRSPQEQAVAGNVPSLDYHPNNPGSPGESHG